MVVRNVYHSLACRSAGLGLGLWGGATTWDHTHHVMMERVYLDYNATTPLAPEVLEAITSALRDAWGNPSSSYHAGKSIYL